MFKYKVIKLASMALSWQEMNEVSLMVKELSRSILVGSWC